MSGWEFVFALPNLRLSPERDLGAPYGWPDGIDLDSGIVAIVGGEDELVTELRRENSSVDQILRGFKDEYGQPYVPAVVVLRSSAPNTLRTSAAAFNDFRNAAALCLVLRGKAAKVGGGGSLDPAWSDIFDFHTVQINPRGTVILQSPAQLTLFSEDDDVNLGPYPVIAIFAHQLFHDRYLYRALGAEWRRRHLSRRNERYSRTLFRALEVAYHATGIGAKTLGSDIEYGTSIAQWVSAFEILAWPKAKHANLVAVLGLLEAAEAPPNLLRRRYSVKLGGKYRPINAIQRCYVLMYRARNRFLHGEPVSSDTLHGRAARVRVALPMLAPLVFRYALSAYLQPRHPLAAPMTPLDDLLAYVDESVYHKALAQVLKVRA